MSAEAKVAAARESSRAGITYLGPNPTIGMAFTFNEYTYNPSVGLSAGTADFRTGNGNVSAVPANTVVFPLPKQLVDNISLSVGGKEIGAKGAIVAGLVQGTNGDISANIIDTISNVRQAATNVGANIANGGISELIQQGMSGANYLTRSGLGNLLPQISQGIEAGLAEAVNPHQTLTFDGVALKQHTFSFEFAPRDDKESKYIAMALHKMKGYALPRYKSALRTGANDTAVTTPGVLARGLLKYPKICNIDFVAGGIDDAFFYKMKPCMISNLSVDYTPQGNSLLRGGRPAFINVSMTLVEQAIHTAVDYDVVDPKLTGA